MFRGTRVELLSVAILPLGLGLAIHGAPAPAAGGAAAPAVVAFTGPVSFSEQVAPLFEEHCVSCHGDETQEAGLRLDSYEAVMKGSEFGTVIEAGDPDGSLLLDMIAAGEMPQEADPMEAEQVSLVRSWVAEGAEDN